MRYADVLQSKAVTECISTDVGNRIGKNYVLDIGNIHKCNHTNVIQRTALFEHNTLHISESVCKCIVADGGDILANDDLVHLIGNVVPRIQIVVCQVGHGALTGNLQRTVVVQFPSQVVESAAFHNNRDVRTSGVADAICLGKFFGISAFRHVQNNVR